MLNNVKPVNNAVAREVNQISCSRRFHWTSSITGDARTLAELDNRLAWFYRQMEGRQLYQELLERDEVDLAIDNSAEYHTIRYILGLNAQKVVEVGCSSGRTYRQLRKAGYKGEYSGVEVANYLIQGNRQTHPEAVWTCADAYSIPFPDNSFDVCFSLYVLEHLVYPEQGLQEMLRVTKPGGQVILVFPDFVQSRHLPSQQRGFSPEKASEKIRQRKWIDALISLFDSKIRLPKALKSVVKNYGPFPINLQPICLAYPDFMEADIDAVYIASADEVEQWAVAQGCAVAYPQGREGLFAFYPLLAIKK